MTDAAPAPQPPALDPNEPPPDPNEILQLPLMMRSEIGNLIEAAEVVRRNGNHEQAKIAIALIDKLVTAQPVEPKPNGDGNRHQRRAKAKEQK